MTNRLEKEKKRFHTRAQFEGKISFSKSEEGLVMAKIGGDNLIDMFQKMGYLHDKLNTNKAKITIEIIYSR